MADVYREVNNTVVEKSPTVVEREPIADKQEPVADKQDKPNIVARVVSLIGGIILAILGIRFVLALLGANQDNGFANFVYTISHPFVVPFFGLFSYKERLGVGRFEFETLVAIAFWAFVTWLAVKLVTIRDRADRPQ